MTAHRIIDTEILLDQAIAAGRAGMRSEAIRLLDYILSVDDTLLDAWLWRGGLAEDPVDSLRCLERAVELAPHDPRAQEGLAWARERLAAVRASITAQPPEEPHPPQEVPTYHHIEDWSLTLDRLPSLTRPLAHGLLALVERIRPMLVTTIQAGGDKPGRLIPVLLIALGIMGTLILALSPSPDAVRAASMSNQGTSSALAMPAPAASPPTLEAAWAAGDWKTVIQLLSARKATGDAAVNDKLFTAHVNYGVQLVRADRFPEAIEQFDKALAIKPDDATALGERQFAQLYYDGLTAYVGGDYDTAIRSFQVIYDGNPSYRQVADKLYAAYVAAGAASEKVGKAGDAQTYYTLASHVRPQGTEAQQALQRLGATSTPTRPSGTGSVGKRIEVDLTKQRVYAYEDGKLVFNFIASTGKAPYVTRTGEFRIKTKIAKGAYSSALRMTMNYWLGIYDAGSTENGFHALPIWDDGRVLPRSALGRPTSNGCIVLDTEDARKLFYWADMGTPVSIHY